MRRWHPISIAQAIAERISQPSGANVPLHPVSGGYVLLLEDSLAKIANRV